MNRKSIIITALLLISPISYFVVESFFPPPALYSTSDPLNGSRLAPGRTRVLLKKIDGLRVTQAEPRSLLHEYGLKSGDLVFKVDGEKIDSLADFKEKVRAHLSGTPIFIEFYRGKEKKSVSR